MGVKRVYIKVAYASFGMVMGFSAFLVWNIGYGQPWTAAMGGLSGKYAANTLEPNPNTSDPKQARQTCTHRTWVVETHFRITYTLSKLC